MLELARTLGLKPYKLTRVLYQLQHFSGDSIAYDLDQESFILEIKHIPHNTAIMTLTDEMLAGTREIEKNLISKLNCMYFAARKVSMPNYDYMVRKEKELTSQQEIRDFYTGFSVEINGLIN